MLNFNFQFRQVDMSPENALVMKRNSDIISEAVNKLEIRIEYSDYFIVKKMTTFDVINLLKDFSGNFTSSRHQISIILDDALLFLSLKHRLEHTTIYFYIYSDNVERIKSIEKDFRKVFSDHLIRDLSCYCNVKWWFKSKTKIDYNYITELFDDVIHPEAYPYVENLDGMIAEFLASEESVFLMMGPPGTGKTRLIRYIVQKMIEKERSKRNPQEFEPDDPSSFLDPEDRVDFNISYTTDSQVVMNDEIFMDMFAENSLAIVLEDIDYHLKDRKNEDALVMYKLLGASSGLIRNISKKIFLSTNLDNIKDIDEALLRPGRCFGTLKTRKLDNDEALNLCKRLNPEFEDSKDPRWLLFKPGEDFSLAQIYKFVKTGTLYEATEPRVIGTNGVEVKKAGF